MKIVSKLILLVVSLAFLNSLDLFANKSENEKNLAYPPENLPDTTVWEYKGATLEDASNTVYQPHFNIHAEWDNVKKTYVLTKQNSKVLKLNTYNEIDDKPWMNYGQRGGDYIITKIIDIRKATNPYLTFLYQRGGNTGGTNTGKSDSTFWGPEFRVIEKANPLVEVRKPDQLLIEFISADSVNLNKLTNPQSSDWNVHPQRNGTPFVTGNPALSIFGGGGSRIGFLENDKDSALTFDEGLRADMYDVGNDDRFERAVVYIPEQFHKNGFIRIRFRVDAERNGNPNIVKDDNDDFFLDDIRIVGNGQHDIALNSLYIQNPYSILNINTKYEIPFYSNISSVYPIKGDSFNLKIRIKPANQPYWQSNQ